MRFLITSSASQIGVPNPVIAVFQGVKKGDASVYDAIIAQTMEKIGHIKQEVLPRADVVGFRNLYEALGHRKVVPAGEKLLRRCEQKGFPRYGNLIDAYNIVALENVTPIGVHDAGCLLHPDATLLFRRAQGNEEMVPAFEEKSQTIPRGDLTYGTISAEKKFLPFAWLGKKDVDNREFQLKDETTTMLLTAIGNMATSEELNRRICLTAFDLLKMSCPDVTMELYTAEVIDDEKLNELLERRTE